MNRIHSIWKKEAICLANTHVYTRKEEIVNAITHGIGVLLSIAALVLLIIYARKTRILHGMLYRQPFMVYPCYFYMHRPLWFIVSLKEK